jgi:hypothetical protein
MLAGKNDSCLCKLSGLNRLKSELKRWRLKSGLNGESVHEVTSLSVHSVRDPAYCLTCFAGTFVYAGTLNGDGSYTTEGYPLTDPQGR